jgi:ABC-type Fe3+-hydroxamate transport system substrate-binding protein
VTPVTAPRPMKSKRVVSLVPSATETLHTLGVDPVGCTRFCDFPGVPVVGGTKNVDVDAVVALEPDLVVVNDEENRIADADALEARGLTLHSMSPRSIADVGPAVVALARALDLTPTTPWVDWDAWLARTRQPVRTTAFVAIWRRPWMSLAADTYGSSLLGHVGIANVVSGATDRYPEIALAGVAELRPDLTLLPSEPYAFAERHVAEVARAIPGARPILVDGRDLFWWGSRTPDAAGRLRHLF